LIRRVWAREILIGQAMNADLERFRALIGSMNAQRDRDKQSFSECIRASSIPLPDSLLKGQLIGQGEV
jgi:hypothetical protein